MSEHAWQARWSAELERSWSIQHRSSGGQGPRMSIRPESMRSSPLRTPDLATRPIDNGEREELETMAVDATTHRRIVVLDPNEPELPVGEDKQEIEVTGFIAKGGMGSVFRGRQVSLDREVAIKRLRPNDKMPEGEAQFESEACITAVLDHPNIVPVYDLGVDQRGRLFYSMKHVRGQPWDALLAEGKEDLRTHLDTLVEVANAVAFAHDKGIIHRDIKPQNVIVGSFGEVLLVDWGLGVAVRPLGEGGRIQDLDQVLITCGTPAYMPPEVALGLREYVGPWTDVYMLGAVLYEVLYASVPHDESTAVDTVKVASDNAWTFPDDIDPEVRPFHEVLKWIVTKSLATKPIERFKDAGEFATAVRGALRHLDSATLASGAIERFNAVQNEEAGAQRERAAGRDAAGFGTVENRYQGLARSIAGIEQALSSWPDNAEARFYLVEAHLLYGHISIVAGDLTQAEAHLQMLANLPHGITLDAMQADKAGKLRRRLDAKLQYKVARRRRALAWTIAAAVLAVTVVVGTAVAAVLIGRARSRVVTERNHLSRLLIASASDGIESELHRIFEPVRGVLQGTDDWTRAGRLDTDAPADLVGYFVPLIDGYPVIASIVRADDQGNEFLLLREPDGWMTRVTAPGRPARFAKLTMAGEIVEEWEEKVDYDPHSRPWYRGGVAMRGAGEEGIAWTAPYTFFTRQEPGITASMPMDSPSGRHFVVGVDVPLSDLSTHTMNLSHSKVGRVFILADDDRVVALPYAERFEDGQARREAVLQPIAELGDAVAAAAVEEWSARGRDSDRRFRLTVGKQAWWGGFRRFELGKDRTFWIGVVLPETDFVIPEDDE